MPEGCIFCRIIEEEAPARVVYEDEDTMAFLDVNPLSEGHTLVVPKEHYETLTDLPESAGEKLMDSVLRLTPEIEAAVDADASTVGFNNGVAAGQEIDHVHGHIVPRFENDGGRPIHAVAGRNPGLSDEELDEIAEDISSTLAAMD